MTFFFSSGSTYAQPRGVFIVPDGHPSFGVRNEREQIPSRSKFINGRIEGSLVTNTATELGGGLASAPSVSGGDGVSFPTTNKVHILGEVESPGIYSISGSTRLTSALQKAGGIRTSGSERFIQLRRKGTSHTFDIYSYKVLGDLNGNPYLQDEDIIYVPLNKKLIQIQGPAKRTGIFELKSERTLRDLLNFNGGMRSGFSSLDPIRVVRYDARGEKHIYEIDLNRGEGGTFLLENSDTVILPHVLLKDQYFDYEISKLADEQDVFYPSFENRVFVIGAVRSGGPIPYHQNYSLEQYVSFAGGKTNLAKKHIYVMRPDGKRERYSDLYVKNAIVNPGDTIIIPEKKFTEQYWIGLAQTIFSLTLSTYAFFR